MKITCNLEFTIFLTKKSNNLKKIILLLMLALVGLASTMAFSPPTLKAGKADSYSVIKQSQTPVAVVVNTVKICGETDVSVSAEMTTFITPKMASKFTNVAKNARTSTYYKRWCDGIKSYSLIKQHKMLTKPEDKVPPLAV